MTNRLRIDGIECEIDQYLNGAPPKGWIRWMEQQIEWADFVLVVCTENYLLRFKGEDRLGGRGVNFEGLLISQTVYDQFLENTKFLPLIPERGSIDHVPLILKGGTIYRIHPDYEQYCRVITDQPAVIKPPTGPIRVLPPDDSVPNQHSPAQVAAITHGHIRRPKPGEPLPPGDPAYIGREADDRLDDEAADSGETFTIKAAADMGKTSLLHRFKADSEADGKTVVLIDFHNYVDERFNDRSSFLKQLAADILRALGRNIKPSSSLQLCKDFTDFIQEEYQRYTYDQGLEPPPDYGLGRDLSEEQRHKLPVVGVSWDDAQAYAAWLSKNTGHRYRLPSEAEWEYAARADTREVRYWENNALGQSMCHFANIADQKGKAKKSWMTWAAECDDGYAEAAPVGSYSANPWGLSDMLGNVGEWTADCQHDSYKGAPADGKVWQEADSCASGLRVLRGGSWNNEANYVRSANRFRFTPDYRYYFIGFRLAQDP